MYYENYVNKFNPKRPVTNVRNIWLLTFENNLIINA
jgi:hypothetical protein